MFSFVVFAIVSPFLRSACSLLFITSLLQPQLGGIWDHNRLQLSELEILNKLIIDYLKYGNNGRTPFCFSGPELMAGVVCVRSIELTFQVLC